MTASTLSRKKKTPKRVSTGTPAPEMEGLGDGVDLESFILQVPGKAKLELDISGSIVGGSVDRTIEGASTVTVEVSDADRRILQSRVLENFDAKLKPVDVQLDGLWFRLAQVRGTGDSLTLVFEDRQIARLRLLKGPRVASRQKVTRAEFCLALVRSVKTEVIGFYSPQLHKRQPLAKQNQKARQKERDSRRKAGFPDKVKLYGKEGRLSKGQLENAATALATAESLDAGAKAVLAMVLICLVEGPDFKNPRSGHGTSVGMYQATDTHGTVAHRRDIVAMTTKCLKEGFTGQGGVIALVRDNPDWSAGQVAQACQGSAFPSRYNMYRAKAAAIIRAWDSGGGGSVRQYKRYSFKVEKKETYWDALVRLATEVNWRVFAVAGTIYYIEEATLLRSRPRMVIGDDTPGVGYIDFDWDTGKRVNKATVNCRLERWQAPPGTVVEMQLLGPAAGKWLVESITRSLFSTEATISLRKPLRSKPEPLPEDDYSNEGGGSASPAQRILAQARRIHRKKYPYVWGGGHGEIGVPTGGGYDCSGGLCAVLEAADMNPGSWEGKAVTSNVLATSWGVPGKGKTFTVYANSTHCFGVVTLKDKEPVHIGTGDWGKGWSGFGVNPRMHPTAGYTARHWPKT